MVTAQAHNNYHYYTYMFTGRNRCAWGVQIKQF
jgi:hypothetical protein